MNLHEQILSKYSIDNKELMTKALNLLYVLYEKEQEGMQTFGVYKDESGEYKDVKRIDIDQLLQTALPEEENTEAQEQSTENTETQEELVPT